MDCKKTIDSFDMKKGWNTLLKYFFTDLLSTFWHYDYAK